MKFAIIAHSWLPEVDSIVDFLEKRKVTEISVFYTGAALLFSKPTFLDHDVIICYSCVPVFLVWNNGFKGRLIIDFPSLSVGRFSSVKDNIKSLFLRMLRLFVNYDFFCLNKNIGSRLSISDYILRPMGVPKEVLGKYDPSSQKAYDFIYLGRLHRPGVNELIVNIVNLGFSVLVATKDQPPSSFLVNGLTCLSFRHSDLISALGSAKIGLNIVPNVEPFSSQTSTKLIEMKAYGMPVLSIGCCNPFFQDVPVIGFDFHRRELYKAYDELIGAEGRSKDRLKEVFSWDEIFLRYRIDKI